MKYIKGIPLIVAPYSTIFPGGIGSWTKNMLDYSESNNSTYKYNVITYSNNLKSVTNTQVFQRIISGIILYFKLFFKMLYSLRMYKPSILHITSSASFGLFKDILLVWLSKLYKIPVIMHWHFGRIPTLGLENNWEWKTLKHLISMIDFCIVIDTKSYSFLLNTGFTNLVCIPNPIGLTVEKESNKFRSQTKQKSQKRVIFVGHVITEKGVDDLVEACSEIPSIEELVFIGPYEISKKKELLKLASRRENGRWLSLVGSLSKEQVLAQMHNASVLVLPSHTEGFPYVVLEAMIMGCAVVATDVGAIPEMLAIKTENPCGICVPVKNIEKLRAAIRTLIYDNEKAETMGKNGITRALNKYTMDIVIRQYYSIWGKVPV